MGAAGGKGRERKMLKQINYHANSQTFKQKSRQTQTHPTLNQNDEGKAEKKRLLSERM